MRRWISVAGLAVALAPGVALADGPLAAAGSADEQTAQSLSDQAYDAYEKGNYAKAIEGYLGSYRLVPTADILYNIASIYDKKLGEPKLAIEYYRRYNAAPDAKPELVGKATARLAALSAPAAGRSGNDAGAAARPSEPSSGSDSGRPLRIVGLGLGGLGIAGLGVGAVTAIVANRKHSDSHCSNGECPSASDADTERSAASMANVSTVSFIAGGALLGAGLVLYLVAPKTAERVAALPLVPHAEARGGGVDLVGHF